MVCFSKLYHAIKNSGALSHTRCRYFFVPLIGSIAINTLWFTFLLTSHAPPLFKQTPPNLITFTLNHPTRSTLFHNASPSFSATQTTAPHPTPPIHYTPDIRIPTLQDNPAPDQSITGLALPTGTNFSTPASSRLFHISSYPNQEALQQQWAMQQALQERSKQEAFINAMQFFYRQLEEHFPSGPDLVCDTQTTTLCTPSDGHLESFINAHWSALSQQFNQAKTLHIERHSNIWSMPRF